MFKEYVLNMSVCWLTYAYCMSNVRICNGNHGNTTMARGYYGPRLIAAEAPRSASVDRFYKTKVRNKTKWKSDNLQYPVVKNKTKF